MSLSVEIFNNAFHCSYLCPQQLLLERFLNRAAEGFQNLFSAVEDHFELCLAKCRTSSQVSRCAKKSMTTRLLLLIQIVYSVKQHKQQTAQLPQKGRNLFVDYELAKLPLLHFSCFLFQLNSVYFLSKSAKIQIHYTID